MKKNLLFLTLAAALCGCTAPQNADNDALMMCVGTYTRGTASHGLYSISFNQSSGEWNIVDSAKVDNPSFAAIHGDMLYCVSESGEDTAAICAFTFKDGHFTAINSVPTKGASPCHVAVIGDKVVAANYSSGSISVIRRDSVGALVGEAEVMTFNNGSRVDTLRQNVSHLHTIMPIAGTNGKYYAADLGGDCLYLLGEKCDTIALPAGCGPRHIAFGEKNIMYVVTEISDEVLVLDIENLAAPKLIQQLPISGINPHGGADIHLSADGKFLYASERLENDGLGIFAVQPDGTLQSVGYQQTGIHPRNFAITPNGKFVLVACRDSNCVEIYSRGEDGLLTLKDKITLPAPVQCLFK